MSVRIDFRAPRKHKEMIRDLARNKRVTEATLYREAIEQFLSGYSQIPTLKVLAEQVERHEKRLNDIEKTLSKRK